MKLPAGSAFAYLSNALHRVNKITRGERLAAVSWFQSMVREDSLRAVLFDYTAVEQTLVRTMNGTPVFDLLSKANQNLLRLAVSL